MAIEKMLVLDEAVHYIGAPRSMFARWAVSGVLLYEIGKDKRLRYKMSALDAFLRKGCHLND